MRERPDMRTARVGGVGPDLGPRGGAGDGNRTRMTSLEGWSSAIELHPRAVGVRPPDQGSASYGSIVRPSGRGAPSRNRDRAAASGAVAWTRPRAGGATGYGAAW